MNSEQPVSKPTYRQQNLEKARQKRLTAIQAKKEADDYKRLLEYQKKKIADLEALNRIQQPVQTQQAPQIQQVEPKFVQAKKSRSKYEDSDDESSDSSEEIIYLKPKTKSKAKATKTVPIETQSHYNSELEELKKELAELKQTKAKQTEPIQAPTPTPTPAPTTTVKDTYTEDRDYLQRLLKYKILHS